MPELWMLAGLSTAQRPAVEEAVRAIRFPWLWLRPKLAWEYGKVQVPVVTSNLDHYNVALEQAATRNRSERRRFGHGKHDHGEHDHDHGYGPTTPEDVLHVHVTDEDGNVGHVVSPPARARVAGLAWSNGKIEIADWCDPVLAREVFSAEAAHATDFFWLTLDQPSVTSAITPMREAVWRTLHGGAFEPHPGHHWFEPAAYGDQVGEGYMALFGDAFYPGLEPWQGAWTHVSSDALGAAVRPAILEAAATVVGLTGYVAVHRQTCRYVTAWRRKGWAYRQTRELAWQRLDLARAWSGRRPCKTCRPA